MTMVPSFRISLPFISTVGGWNIDECHCSGDSHRRRCAPVPTYLFCSPATNQRYPLSQLPTYSKSQEQYIALRPLSSQDVPSVSGQILQDRPTFCGSTTSDEPFIVEPQFGSPSGGTSIFTNIFKPSSSTNLRSQNRSLFNCYSHP